MNGNWGNRSPALAWYYRGVALSQLADDEQALVAYDRTLLLEPNDSQTLTARCEALLNLRRSKDKTHFTFTPSQNAFVSCSG